MYVIEEKDTRFYVKESTIPNAGAGCFSKVPLRIGDYLEVIGVYVPVKSAADICTAYANRYKFAAKEGYTCYIVPMGFGGMVNHTNDPSQQNVEIRWIKGMNKKSPHAGEIVYAVIKDIEPDQELLGNYGEALSQEMSWAAENAERIDKSENEWKLFLSHNLYNLGILQEL